MKKAFAAVLILAIIVSFAACGTNNQNNLADKNTYEYEGIIVAMPDDFSVNEDNSSVIARPDSYPDKTDNIAFTRAGKDSAANYDKEILEKSYKSSLSGFTGISRFEKGSVDGNDSIVITYGIKYDDIQMIQTQAIVFLKDKSVVITYTSVSGNYDDEFDFSIENLTVAD